MKKYKYFSEWFFAVFVATVASIILSGPISIALKLLISDITKSTLSCILMYIILTLIYCTVLFVFIYRISAKSNPVNTSFKNVLLQFCIGIALYYIINLVFKFRFIVSGPVNYLSAIFYNNCSADQYNIREANTWDISKVFFLQMLLYMLFSIFANAIATNTNSK